MIDRFANGARLVDRSGQLIGTADTGAESDEVESEVLEGGHRGLQSLLDRVPRLLEADSSTPMGRPSIKPSISEQLANFLTHFANGFIDPYQFPAKPRHRGHTAVDFSLKKLALGYGNDETLFARPESLSADLQRLSADLQPLSADPQRLTADLQRRTADLL